MSAKKIITVFGATGTQGGGIVDTFLHDSKLNKEWQVRGVTRDATKDSSKKLAERGVEVVSADLSDKESLQKAMENAAAVFAVTNYWETMDHELELQQGKNVADAAKAAGVKHLIWSSLINVNEVTKGKLPHVYHFDSKAKVEAYIRQLGIPATFFMPGMYDTFFPGNSLRQNSPSDPWTLSLPMPEHKAQLPLFHPTDTGKWVKAIVLKREQLLGKNVHAAWAYRTPAQMVEDFKATFPEAGKGMKYVLLTEDQFRGGLTSHGLPDFAAEELYENFRLTWEEGYYNGASLEESHALLDPEDKLTTWSDFLKISPVTKDLK